MSEPFVKLHSWMTGLGLSASELICFAVIHGYTEYAGGYQGGMEALGKWCGLARSHVYPVIKSLTDKQLIAQTSPSKGRNAAVYVSLGKPSHIGTVEGRLTVPYSDGKPSHIGTHIDNIDNIDNNPLNPPKRGTERKPYRRSRRQNPALDYKDDTDYSREALRANGISFGEEFYSDE